MRAIIKTPEYQRRKAAIEAYYEQFANPDDEEQIYNLEGAMADSIEDLDERFTVDIE